MRAMNPKESVIHIVDALKNIMDLDVAETNMASDHLWGREARPSDGQRTSVIYQLICAEFEDWAEKSKPQPSNTTFNTLVAELALDVERQTQAIIDEQLHRKRLLMDGMQSDLAEIRQQSNVLEDL